MTTEVRPGSVPAQRFVGFSPHQDVVPQGKRLEMLEVFRQAPGQGVGYADDAVSRHCGDDGKTGFAHIFAAKLIF